MCERSLIAVVREINMCLKISFNITSDVEICVYISVFDIDFTRYIEPGILVHVLKSINKFNLLYS